MPAPSRWALPRELSSFGANFEAIKRSRGGGGSIDEIKRQYIEYLKAETIERLEGAGQDAGAAGACTCFFSSDAISAMKRITSIEVTDARTKVTVLAEKGGSVAEDVLAGECACAGPPLKTGVEGYHLGKIIFLLLDYKHRALACVRAAERMIQGQIAGSGEHPRRGRDLASIDLDLLLGGPGYLAEHRAAIGEESSRLIDILAGSALGAGRSADNINDVYNGLLRKSRAKKTKVIQVDAETLTGQGSEASSHL